MKNSLSHILSALQVGLAEAPDARTWAANTEVISLEDVDTGSQVWWFKESSMGTLISASQLEELVEEGLLVNNGVAHKKRFSRQSICVFGVRIGELRKAVRTCETKASKTALLGKRVKELESELRTSRENAAMDDAMASLMSSIQRSYKPGSQKQVFSFDKHMADKSQTRATVPTLFCSDWHWGEVVKADRIMGVNHYDLATAHERADRVLTSTMETLFHHHSGMSYDGFVFALGGDMVSGNMLEELRNTNEESVVDCVMSLAAKLTSQIIELAENFPGVFVPCVVGNHGRIDMRPNSKMAASNSFDALVYRIVKTSVEGRLHGRCNVDFKIGTGIDLTYGLYSTGYLLTHGDTGKSGYDAGGFHSTMQKTAAKKLTQISRGNTEHKDYLICGHHHRYTTASNYIVNGSLKGYDEWGNSQGYAPERPTQALWLTGPEHGLTQHIAIYADESSYDSSLNVAPISPNGFIPRNR